MFNLNFRTKHGGFCKKKFTQEFFSAKIRKKNETSCQQLSDDRKDL